jgi:hypothetical protein
VSAPEAELGGSGLGRTELGGAVLGVLLTLLACGTTQDTPAPAEPVCPLYAYRSCEHACGRGVQQCLEPNIGYAACECALPIGDGPLTAGTGGEAGSAGAGPGPGGAGGHFAPASEGGASAAAGMTSGAASKP